MDQLHRASNQRLRQVLQGTQETSEERSKGRKGTLRQSNSTVQLTQRPIQAIARRIRQNAKGYRDYLVIARQQAGITSISDFEQLNPYLLDAMIEGYERQQLDQRVKLANMLQQTPLMAQWVTLDQNSISQISSAIQESIEQELSRIDKEHKNELDANDEEVKQADIMAKILEMRKSKQEGGK